MASPFPAQPPGIGTIVSSPPPSWEPWRPRPSKKNPMDSSSSQGGVIAGLVIGFMATLLLFTLVWSTSKGRREARDSRGGAGAGTATGNDDHHLRRASASSQTAGLPAFTYSPSVKHNVTDDGEDATTCSVCLAAFQLGETVRLLPACLHLYHVECIDPWLDAHSTCPLCRSDTYPTMDVV